MNKHIRLKEVLSEKGITQKEFAKRVNRSEQSISNINAGTMPSLTDLAEFANVLECDLVDLIRKPDLTPDFYFAVDEKRLPEDELVNFSSRLVRLISDVEEEIENRQMEENAFKKSSKRPYRFGKKHMHFDGEWFRLWRWKWRKQDVREFTQVSKEFAESIEHPHKSPDQWFRRGDFVSINTFHVGMILSANYPDQTGSWYYRVAVDGVRFVQDYADRRYSDAQSSINESIELQTSQILGKTNVLIIDQFKENELKPLNIPLDQNTTQFE